MAARIVFGLLNLRHKRRWRVLWGTERRPWVLPAYLVGIFWLHVAAMMVLEGMTFIEGVWLTATTIVTVGYGDLSAKTPEGRIATMVLMYVGAIFIVAIAINDWLDRKAERLDRKANGTWRWNLARHVLIVGTPRCDATDFFARIARQIRHQADWAEAPILLLTTSFDGKPLPPVLRDLGVVHRNGRIHEPCDLEACDPSDAAGAIILAESESDAACDSMTFDAIHRLREAGLTGTIVAECIEDANRQRLTRAGATSLVRPMRGFPEALTRALFAPGSEAVIENLFTAEGDECLLIPLKTPWRGPWLDVVTRLVGSGAGTPIAYRDPTGRVRTNPLGSSVVEATALYVIVHDVREARAGEDVARLLAR